MRLIALDLETTGLDPQKDQILEIGMACFESDTGEIVGEFETIVRHARYEGDPFALSMNAALLKRLAYGEGKRIYQVHQPIVDTLDAWGFDSARNRPIAVGFNVAPFDLAFLKAAGINLFHHRAVEIGTLLMGEFDSPEPVTSNTFMEYEGGEVAHTALADCHMAIRAYELAMNITL